MNKENINNKPTRLAFVPAGVAQRLTAHIIKNYGRQIGWYVVCAALKNNVFFERYREAKDFCESKGWDALRVL